MSKVNISISEGLLERVDEYCRENSLSRSGLISLSLNQYLTSQEVIVLLRNLNSTMQKIAEGNMLEEEIVLKLREYQHIINMMVLK